MLLVSVLAVEEYSFDTLDGVDRYIRFDRQPKPDDKEKAIIGGGDVKCDVCEVILTNVLDGLGAKTDKDAILEALEADWIDEDKVEATNIDMLKHVEKKKVGCNRLYKDQFLAKGWDGYGCYRLMEGQTEDGTPPFEKAPWLCTQHTGKVPNTTEINTYSVKMESLFYACESTIGRHREKIASLLAKRLKKLERASVKDITADACRQKAKCEERQPNESVEVRAKQNFAEYHGRQQGVLDNYLADEKEKKKKAKEEEKAKKRAEREARKKKRKSKDSSEL